MHAHNPVNIAANDEEMTFHEFVAFNTAQVAVFRAEGSGAGPWEIAPRHRRTALRARGMRDHRAVRPCRQSAGTASNAGSLVVVPRDRWHRHVDASNLAEFYYTPGQSLSCADPSTASENVSS